ncbi:TetR family transcriptional regulator [Nocardioides albertanoniae]|uniref:TetR family transcriptional regulator n=1 Tax=Nocardioides albertanoniae TaxID=1175486 RepID=A0A543AA14_9ACTN|nr:TetR family transcriptional regulator C-terminal domain-containing protein [Nocardioides albertanoniae]TQL69447.1 TetR family transcriptional regulator [Nocardioides albertanoniae]
MPKQVDHRERRETIAHALWRVVERQGWSRATMREVSREADVSLGQLQHYFSSRAAMLTFAMEFAAEQVSHRVNRGLAVLDQPPHPREVLRVTLLEMLPLRPEARATDRMNAAYVLEALHDPELREQACVGLRDGRDLVERLVREAQADGHIPAGRDPAVETDLILALTGFTPLLELGVVEPPAAVAAIDQHLDRLFSS